MVRREAPGQTEDGSDDGDCLVRLEHREVQTLVLAHREDPQGERGGRHCPDQDREEDVQLDGRLETGLQANFHDPGRGVEHFRGFYFLLPLGFLSALGQIVFAVVVVLDEENGDRPEEETADKRD